MNRFKRYLSTEIVIEYKACLYFYALLFFYCLYCIISKKSFSASIIVMAEMIATTYIMGYIQLYLFRNFDEGERLGKFEGIAILVCSLVYTGISYLCLWFDRDKKVTLFYFAYMIFLYVCMFCINKVKRDIDTKQLNEELEQFKNKKDIQ